MQTYVKVIGSGVAILLAGTGAYLYNQVLKLKSGTFKVLGVKNLLLSGNKLSLTLVSQFKNNSDIPATIKDQDYDVFINDKRVANVHNVDSIKIASNNYNIVELKVDVNLNSVLIAGLANLGNIFNNKDAIKIKLKGTLKWQSGIISAKQPFEINYTLKEIQDLANKNKTP